MSKRYSESSKWTNSPWFRKLKPKMKCMWEYMRDNCDSVGAFVLDSELASMLIGEPISEDEFRRDFEKQIFEFKPGKFWIRDFVDYQYGPIKPASKPHQYYIKTLKSHGLWDVYLEQIEALRKGSSKELLKGIATLGQGLSKGYPTLTQGLPKGSLTLKEKEKEKEKEKDQDQEKEEGVQGEEPKRKHAFEKSPIGTFQAFRQAFPDWTEEKCAHYFDRAQGYSEANGGRYLSWKRAVQNWDRDKPWGGGGQVSETHVADEVRRKREAAARAEYEADPPDVDKHLETMRRAIA